MNVLSRKSVVGAVGTMLVAGAFGSASLAAPTATTPANPAAPSAHRAMQKQTHHIAPRPARANSSHANQEKANQETVTLVIRGASSLDDAKLLGWTLTAHQIQTAVSESKEGMFRTTTAISPRTDLGAAGQAISKTQTANKSKSPPSLDLVLFGKFDQAAAKKATEVLNKVKGVDAKDSVADPSSGEINVRIQGGAKVTADQVRHALRDAGITTQFTRNGAMRQS
ncbi:MAG: hypothetical protein AB7G28_19510 [Pirellulales bacterium]